MALDFDDLYGTTRILAAIAALDAKLEAITMSLQEDVDAITGVLNDVKSQSGVLVTDVTAIQAALAAGQPPDLSALDNLVSNAKDIQSALDSAVGSVNALVPPPPAPTT